MDFNDQIFKTIFGNAFNNEMHKKFIAFFIPATYIAYYTMLHGMSNQFEVLRMKNGTTTTVIKATGSFTTVDSITNHEMTGNLPLPIYLRKWWGGKQNGVSQPS